MGRLKIVLRILLSLSVFVAGLGHAMPVDPSDMVGVGSRLTPTARSRGSGDAGRDP